jgi:hypothetical protein
VDPRGCWLSLSEDHAWITCAQQPYETTQEEEQLMRPHTEHLGSDADGSLVSCEVTWTGANANKRAQSIDADRKTSSSWLYLQPKQPAHTQAAYVLCDFELCVCALVVNMNAELSKKATAIAGSSQSLSLLHSQFGAAIEDDRHTKGKKKKNDKESESMYVNFVKLRLLETLHERAVTARGESDTRNTQKTQTPRGLALYPMGLAALADLLDPDQYSFTHKAGLDAAASRQQSEALYQQGRAVNERVYQNCHLYSDIASGDHSYACEEYKRSLEWHTEAVKKAIGRYDIQKEDEQFYKVHHHTHSHIYSCICVCTRV